LIFSSTDLIAIGVVLGAGFALCYVLLLWKVRALVAQAQLRIADQIGGLDDAIRALETRIAKHKQIALNESSPIAAVAESIVGTDRNSASDSEENVEIAPEIQAAIEAATVTVLGPNRVVQSVTTVPSPWTQQGRVLVQGGHNFRVRR